MSDTSSTSIVMAGGSAAETAVAAAQSYQLATVQSRIIAAHANPRNWDRVREEVLRECRRPGFATFQAGQGGALYKIPYGDSNVTGFTIRFAEVVARCLGNMLIEAPIVFDDADKRVFTVLVTDLEKNTTWSKSVTVVKRVERRKVPPGRTAISERRNSRGQPVYLVAATDDEISAKSGAEVSKACRTGIERHIPGWLRDECMAELKKTMANSDARDPDAEKRTLLDFFSSQHGVSVQQLIDFVGHPADEWTAKDIDELRAVAEGLRDKQFIWAQVMESRGGDAKTDEKPAAKGTENDKLIAKLPKKEA